MKKSFNDNQKQQFVGLIQGLLNKITSKLKKIEDSEPVSELKKFKHINPLTITISICFTIAIYISDMMLLSHVIKENLTGYKGSEMLANVLYYALPATFLLLYLGLRQGLNMLDKRKELDKQEEDKVHPVLRKKHNKYLYLFYKTLLASIPAIVIIALKSSELEAALGIDDTLTSSVEQLKTIAIILFLIILHEVYLLVITKTIFDMADYLKVKLYKKKHSKTISFIQSKVSKLRDVLVAYKDNYGEEYKVVISSTDRNMIIDLTGIDLTLSKSDGNNFIDQSRRIEFVYSHQ